MTTETNDTYVRLVISGTGPYQFDFRIFDALDLVVHVDTGGIDPAALTLTTHYSVSGVDESDGGSITLTSEIAATYAGDMLDIRSSVALKQPTSVRNQGSFLPEIHEDAFDRLSRQIQDLFRMFEKALRLPDSSERSGLMFPLSTWASRWIYINADGDLEPSIAITPQALTQSIVAQLLTPQTQAEIDTSAVPVNFFERAGFVERYATNTTPGTTDMSAALASACAQALAAGGEPVKARTVLHVPTATDINAPLEHPSGAQLFSATSSVTFSKGSVEAVYPDWWGSAVGAINKAQTSVAGRQIPVRLNPGNHQAPIRTYQFLTPLTLSNDGDSIVGPGTGNATSGGNFYGAVLEFTGAAGTAITCGIAPGTNGNFMEGVRLSGFSLKLTETTDIGIRLWHVSGLSHIHDMTIRGSSDADLSDNIAIQIEGCVDLDIERVLIFGQGAAGLGTSLLENGIKVMNGFSSSNTTTTRFRQVYISQCRTGALITDDCYVAFDHCVFESCYDAGLMTQNSRVQLYDPWFEANGASGNPPIRMQGAASSVHISGGLINVGTAQRFIQIEANGVLTLLGGTRFASSHGSPQILSLGGTLPRVTIVGENSYPAAIAYSDTALPTLSVVNGGVMRPPSHTVAGVPAAAANVGGLIYVSNEAGGAVPAFSDGAAWRRVTDRAVIS